MKRSFVIFALGAVSGAVVFGRRQERIVVLPIDDQLSGSLSVAILAQSLEKITTHVNDSLPQAMEERDGDPPE